MGANRVSKLALAFPAATNCREGFYFTPTGWECQVARLGTMQATTRRRATDQGSSAKEKA